ncbi:MULTISPECIES: alkene reductase [Streptomyces]|uniref:alkene reductase n=1 Tax=Streptomyces TaxID=1883 RepID=UPI0006AD446C|nr:MULTISPECIES: alkene reductase [Streptomyces]ALC30579.1 1,2-oxophytodienoate reductase [Streptomyces sp. CFMR 7]MBT3075243.1 alkene reductase [Streptomyces sp. COG21]MBT3084277.1 alkene reductase [Streptomyces sp. COG20]MBT3090973.1 alkene reductase [Streptomyces sp. CYG21]MBT3099304.1 alkene reductase [Streptomyces sp. CBG30]
MTTAFDPIDLAGTPLANRIVMAPMTRSRAGEGGTATELTAAYYAQRASAGLIVTEGIQPSAVGQGYPFTPGLHSAEQVASWRKVTDAVHAEGGRIFAQIMHAGRIGHPVLLPDGLVPVAPSPVRAAGQVFTAEGPKDFVEPHELTDEEIRQTIADFVSASRNAIEAGFDGVELHGANGYLIHQFLAPNTNLRTDAWGGSDERRVRFAAEVVKAVAAEIGGARTALRISPSNPYNDIDEPAPDAVYTALAQEIEPLGLAYLHILEDAPIRELTLQLRKVFTGPVLINVHSDGPTGPDDHTVIDDGIADLISYGVLFLANPDLPARLKAGGPFNTPDPSTFFGGDAKGYTDYPALDAV